jgi:hypothetical protein
MNGEETTMATTTARRTNVLKIGCMRCRSRLFRDALFTDEFYCLNGHRFVVKPQPARVPVTLPDDDEQVAA